MLKNVFSSICDLGRRSFGRGRQTADERPIVASLGFRYVPSTGLFMARLVDDKREIEVKHPSVGCTDRNRGSRWFPQARPGKNSS